jgi:hypothetical protein
VTAVVYGAGHIGQPEAQSPINISCRHHTAGTTLELQNRFAPLLYMESTYSVSCGGRLPGGEKGSYGVRGEKPLRTIGESEHA